MAHVGRRGLGLDEYTHRPETLQRVYLRRDRSGQGRSGFGGDHAHLLAAEAREARYVGTVQLAHAAQQPLRLVAIDEAASAMAKPQTADQQARLSQDIQERVVTIFEACNFQDLTGQRISKVMTTMKFIEHHINVMMEIWGGVDAIKAHAPAIVDERVGDARLLNGPKGPGEEGHASQGDIDALFG